jgi:hypothetical protein
MSKTKFTVTIKWIGPQGQQLEVNKHVADFNGKLTDFVECDYFKSVVEQLLLEQHRKTIEDTIDRCIQTIEHAANNLVKYRRKEGKPYVLASAGLLKTLKHNICESKIT